MTTAVHPAEVTSAPTQHNAQATLLEAAPGYQQFDRLESGYPPVLVRSGVANLGRSAIQYNVHYPADWKIGEGGTRLIIPGYYGCQEFYEPLAIELARRGETAITYVPPRSGDTSRLNPDTYLDPQRLSSKAAKAVIIDASRKNAGIESVDSTGNSMGGKGALVLAEASIEDPSLPPVTSVTLLGSAGVTNHNLISMSRRTLALRTEMRQVARASKERKDNLRWEIAKYALENIIQTTGEGLQVSGCRIRPDRIANLQENGVKVVGIFHDADSYFPAHEAYRSIGHIVDKFVFGGPSHGGHLSPYLYPEEVAQDCYDSLELLGLRQPVAA